MARTMLPPFGRVWQNLESFTYCEKCAWELDLRWVARSRVLAATPVLEPVAAEPLPVIPLSRAGNKACM